jgi:hypothetical protein
VDVQGEGFGEKEGSTHEGTFPTIFVAALNKLPDRVEMVREVIEPCTFPRFPEIVFESVTDAKIFFSIRT